MSHDGGSIHRMIVNAFSAVAALAAVVGGLAVYDVQRWCERREYDRHFND